MGPAAGREPIAIVGIGCRFPGGADSPQTFWMLLREGVDAVTEIPADRAELRALYDPQPGTPGKIASSRGGFLPGVDLFDPYFFGISPREANAVDPQQRLLLEVTWEAFEDAGIAPDRLASQSVGVFVGMWTNDYEDRMYGATSDIDLYVTTGGGRYAASGRLSYAFDLRGPSLTLDTACSSSLVAVHLACQSLRAGECELALAAGTNLILEPYISIGYSRSRMLSPDGRCKFGDASANGYVRSEGVGLVLLKTLRQALADGDSIYALIRGSAVNNDGQSGGALVAPGTGTQETMLLQAYRNAGVEPSRVGFVEAHGTGTSVGDPVELAALGAVLGPGRPPERPCLVGSVKTNIGHTEAASGLAGLIKAALCLKHREIPPSLHCSQPNPKVPWRELALRVQDRLIPWPEGEGPAFAGVNSFGVTGTNAHVVLEEAPAAAPQPAGAERPLHLLTMSAKDERALRRLAGRLRPRVLAKQEPLADLCYSANTGRAQHAWRGAVLARTQDEAADRLLAVEEGRDVAEVFRGETGGAGAPEVAFLFTGQGSQYAGMARELYETQPRFKEALERCEEILRPHLARPLLSVLYPEAGGSSPIDETGYTQPCLFAVEWALSELWRSWGVEPTVVLGHSVGEYVAASVAGVFSLEDGLRLVAERGRLMQGLPPGGAMAAVTAPEGLVRELLLKHEGRLAIGAVNSPEDVTVSGEKGALDDLLSELGRREVSATRLRVSHAFHSPLVEPMLGEFEKAAKNVEYQAPRIGMVLNLTGARARGEEREPGYWVRQTRETVRFAAGMDALRSAGCNAFLEVGPGTVLLGLGRRCLPQGYGAWLPSLRRGRGDWQQMLESLSTLYVGGSKVDWRGFDRAYVRRKTPLPTYPFERQRYWFQEAAKLSPRPPATLPVAEARPGLEDWGYASIWKPKPLRPVLHGSASAAGRWLILQDRCGVGRALAQELGSRGGDCSLLLPGAAAELELAEAMLAGSGDASLPVRGVVHLWALDAPQGEDVSDSALADTQRVTCGGLLNIVQTLERAGASGRPRVWVVTRGAQPADSRPLPLAVAQATLWGLGKVVGLEHPELRCVRIDLDPGPNAGETAMLVDELLRDDAETEDQVAFRPDARRVARLARAALPASTSRDAVRPDASYLITGGLGGLGLLVARWLADRGGRYLVLMGRREPSAAAAAQIAEIERTGATVVVARGDVSDERELARALQICEQTGRPLRGIVHAAGVVDDGVLLNQDWSRFAKVMQPKVQGAWNLHRLTREKRLDFLVFFSSSAALLGSAGQGNYAAANAFLDALAHHRRGIGLAALSVNWGPWARVGLAVDLGLERRLSQRGLDALDPDAGLRAFGLLLGSAAAQVGVVACDWRLLLQQLPPGSPFYEDFQPKGLLQATAADAGRQPGLRERLARQPASRRAHLLEEMVRSEVVKILGLDHSRHVDAEQPLRELGMDSLMAVELRNGLALVVDRALPATLLFDHPTVGRLVGYLGGEVLSLDLGGEVAQAEEEAQDPGLALEALSEDQMAALLASRLDTLHHGENR